MFKSVWLPPQTDINLLSFWFEGSEIERDAIFDHVFKNINQNQIIHIEIKNDNIETETKHD